MRSLLAFLLVVLALPAAAQDRPDKCEIENATSPYEIFPTAGYDHDKFGPFPTGLVREFGVFKSSFDDDDDDDGDGQPDFRAVPEWVAYEIKAFTQDANGQFEKPEGIKRNKWYRHSDLAFLWSSPGTKKGLDHSYSGVGNTFNRGHLAMKLHGDRIGWKQGCNTHFFFNAVPQRAKFNKGIWLDLEILTGAWANKFSSVWVIAGPIFNDGEPVTSIGDPDEVPVAVPNALFKIVIREVPGSNLPETLAFIHPQDHPDYVQSCKRDKHDQTKFLTTIAAIETQTGLRFFQSLSLTRAEWDQLLNGKAEDLWPVEPRFFGHNCGGL